MSDSQILLPGDHISWTYLLPNLRIWKVQEAPSFAAWRAAPSVPLCLLFCLEGGIQIVLEHGQIIDVTPAGYPTAFPCGPCPRDLPNRCLTARLHRLRGEGIPPLLFELLVRSILPAPGKRHPLSPASAWWMASVSKVPMEQCLFRAIGRFAQRGTGRVLCPEKHRAPFPTV